MLFPRPHLGVTVDKDLKFNKHIANAVNNANKILGVIKRTFECLDHDTIPTLFKALVRPHLEYANSVWSPRYKKDDIALEKVQRRATKMIKEIKDLPYGKRLEILKLPSLHYCRKRGDMIQVFKIISGIDRLDSDSFFVKSQIQGTRGNQHKIFKKRATLDIWRNSFSIRIVNDWNSLPNDVVNAKTLNDFKSRLDAHWEKEQYYFSQ